jgi:hypothetical protein
LPIVASFAHEASSTEKSDPNQIKTPAETRFLDAEHVAAKIRLPSARLKISATQNHQDNLRFPFHIGSENETHSRERNTSSTTRNKKDRELIPTSLIHWKTRNRHASHPCDRRDSSRSDVTSDERSLAAEARHLQKRPSPTGTRTAGSYGDRARILI